MNCLSDLKEALLKQGQKVSEFTGYQLIYKDEVYSMSLGEFFVDGEPIEKKVLIDKLKLKK
jgi:hypothetical protein